MENNNLKNEELKGNNTDEKKGVMNEPLTLNKIIFGIAVFLVWVALLFGFFAAIGWIFTYFNMI